MSLTSYRAAPPRVNLMVGLYCAARSLSGGIFDKIPGAAPPRVKDGRCALICMKGFDEGVLFCIALIDLAATYSPAP